MYIYIFMFVSIVTQGEFASDSVIVRLDGM